MCGMLQADGNYQLSIFNYQLFLADKSFSDKVFDI